MIYYAIRHKATLELMPQIKRGRGYSHWNPSKVQGSFLDGAKLVGVPRLLPSKRVAQRCIDQWNAIPNGRMGFDHEGEVELDIKSDGRKKEDLEIIEVELVISNESR
jgi:hypothetical protein